MTHDLFSYVPFRSIIPPILLSIASTVAAQSRPASTQPAPASRAATQPASSPTRDFREDRTAGYKLDDGPFAVGSEDDFELYDKARDKKLQMTIRYPKGVPQDRKLPLIIFSHGAGGASDAFSDLSEHWAGHGYVVIHPTHSDSLKLRRKSGEDLSALRADPDQLRRNVNIVDRIADVRLILDSLEKIEAKFAPLKLGGEGRIDRAHMAIAGHSAGAYTAQVALGAKIRTLRPGAAGQRLAEGRFRAGILISGQGLTNRTFQRDSWSEMKKPMMVFAGSLDVAAIGNETPESRRHPYEFAPAGNKFLVYIEGATHGSYQGKALARLLNEKPTTDIRLISDAVSSATLAFWDCYLGKANDGCEYLQGEKLAKLGGGAVEYKKK